MTGNQHRLPRSSNNDFGTFKSILCGLNVGICALVSLLYLRSFLGIIHQPYAIGSPRHTNYYAPAMPFIHVLAPGGRLAFPSFALRSRSLRSTNPYTCLMGFI